MTEKEKKDGRGTAGGGQPAAKRTPVASAGRDAGSAGSRGSTGRSGSSPAVGGGSKASGGGSKPSGGSGPAGGGATAASPATAPTGAGAGAGARTGGGSDPASGTGAGARTVAGSPGPSTATEPLAESDLRIDDPPPEVVSLDDVRRSSTPGGPRARASQPPPKPKAPSVRTALEMLLKATYAVPALAGYGEHWYLTEDEAKTLAEQADAAVAGLPASKMQALSKIIATWAPAIGFAFTAIAVTSSRVSLTKRMYAARAGETLDTGHAATPGGETPSGNGTRTSGPPGTVKDSRARLFRIDE